MKSQGNQLTKLKIKGIELTHPIEGDTPWPEPEEVEAVEENATTEQTTEEVSGVDNPSEMEWDMTKDKKDKPNPIKEDDDDSQGSLF
jgi:topoisomerase-4 subunit A